MKSVKLLLFVMLVSPLFAKSTEIPAEGMIPVRGAELYYRIIGAGEPLVIIHGGPGMDHSYLLPQMEILSKQYKLIFYDQRACGKSSVNVDSSSMNIDRFVEDLEAVRIFFKLEKMNVFGHSFGGLIAMRYAIKYESHLKTMMLVNSTPASSAWRDSSFALMSRRSDPQITSKTSALLKTEAFKMREPDTMAYFFRLLFTQSFYDPSKVSQLTLRFQDNFPESNKMINFLHKDSALIKYDLLPELMKVKIPVLIIGSEADIIPPMATEALHKAL